MTLSAGMMTSQMRDSALVRGSVCSNGSRTSLLLDVHRYAAIETDTADGFSFWRTVLAARVRF